MLARLASLYDMAMAVYDDLPNGEVRKLIGKATHIIIDAYQKERGTK